jgi:hypothetical protein
MRSAAVPAQITTVEDKIAGNLTLQQMLFLTTPAFIDFAVYAILPHMLKLEPYKIFLMFTITTLSCLMAIRIKNQILFAWIHTILNFNRRPRYYVFDKNSLHLRKLWSESSDSIANVEEGNGEHLQRKKVSEISNEDMVIAQSLLGSQTLNISFSRSRKGELYVVLPEIE